MSNARYLTCSYKRYFIAFNEIFLQNDMLAFDDDFEAWPFGPVIPEVYYRYCGFGALGICIKYDVDMDSDYAAIINPIIERKRMMNSWDWSKDINTSGKA